MKALEKDRARRYQTASGFANDIERYLNGEAVLACPPSAAYRFKKFARRNKTVLSTLAFVAAALVLGMIGTSWQAIRAIDAKQLAGERLVAEQRARDETDRARRAEVKQRSLAEQERDRAEENLQLATAEQQRAEGNLDLALAALESLYLKAIGRDRLLGEPVAAPGAPEPPESGLRPPLNDLERELLQRGLDFYDQFAQKNAAAPRSFVQTAQAYYRVGLLQGALGNPAAAAAAHRSAVERFERLTQEDPDNAEHFRGLGDVHLYLGYRQPDWDVAKKARRSSFLAYSRAIELRPNDPALYLSRAQSRGASDRQGVLEDYETVIRLDPHNLDALLQCAEYYRRDIQKGRGYAEQAVATAPEDPRGHIALANVLGEVEIGGVHPRKHAAAALEHYARAIELAPISPEGYSARGAFYFFNQDHQLALTDLNRALELNSGDRYALRTRARVFVELGEYDKALADLAVVSKTLPNWVSVHRVTGDAHFGKENWQAAIDAYTRVVEIDPASWSILKRRAFAYANLRQYPQALADLKRALELNPNEISTLSWIPPRLVDACPDPSFRESLLELAAKAADKSPDRPRALQDRASFYLGLREWKRAIADLETAIKSETADHDAHYRHALLCLMLNEAQQYRDACAAMVRKIGESDDPMAVNFVAWTCALAPEAVEDYERVIACATKAVEARPDSDQFLNTLGAILYRAGRQEAAIEWLTELNRPQENAAARADSSLAYTGYFLAMAHKMIGKEEQAREYLRKAKQRTEEELAEKQDPLPWNRRATLELLRVEAEALLAAPAAVPEPSDQKAPQPTVDAELSLGGPYRWVLHVRRAGRFAAEGNWTEAAGALSQAIQLRPDNWALWRALGEAHEQLDQWDTALADYQKAMELKPQEWRHWQTRAENLAQSGQADKAIALYASLIELHSDNAALWKARGEVREKADQWDAAIADYQKAMELEPKQRPVWKARAKQYAQSEQWGKAITLYTSLLQHSADDPELWQARAVAHAGLKQWDQAIADYGQLIQRKPDDVNAWRQRARAYVQLKAHDKAIADYSAIIQLKPDDPKAWGERAQANFNLADYDKAIADRSQAIRLDPTNSWHYIGRAQAQSVKMENYDRALADCNEAIRLDPQNLWGYAGRALVHLLMRNYDGAIADSSEALRPPPSRDFPPCPWGYVHRAEAYLAKGDYGRAVADCQEAIQLLPEYYRSYMLRAEALLTLRRYDDAVADSNKYVELEPADPTAALIRAQTLLMADRTEEYRQACGQILDRFEQSQDPAALCHAARACVLAPKAISDSMVPVKLAERAVASKPAEWALYTLGIAQFRAGQLEAAAQRFHESLKTAPSWEARFLNWLGLALVCHGLGETQQAREWLGKAIPLIEQRSARFTQDRIEGQLLRREVEQLLEKSEQEKQGAQAGKEK